MENLTKSEWVRLNVWLCSASDVYCNSWAENKVAEHILLRTLQFDKFEEIYRPSWLIHGNGAVFCLRSCFSRKTLWRAAKNLEDRQVIQFGPMGRYGARVAKLNCPGIVEVLADLQQKRTKDIYATESDARAAEMLSRLHAKLTGIWLERNWEIHDVVMGEEKMDGLSAIREGTERSTKAMERKHEKRKSKEMKPSWVMTLMRQYAKESGVSYTEVFETQKDRLMALGCAKNFIKYCKGAELDPREVLKDVVERWHEFGNLKNSEGKYAMISSSVNFLVFFRYRREIMDYLASNRQVSLREWINVTDETEKEPEYDPDLPLGI